MQARTTAIDEPVRSLWLVDSSVWIGHFRKTNPEFQQLLSDDVVFAHPFVIGELACGSMKNRKQVLEFLNLLPLANSATHEEVLHLLDRHALWSRGIGWIDAHLIASALLTRCALWTLDESLRSAAASARVPVR
jgi:predicted nucleic acid-binding protein